MPKRWLVLISVGALSLTTTAQERTAREYVKVRGMQYSNASAAIVLGLPHACRISEQHSCIYYGGDIDPNDPQEDGLSNENTWYIPKSFTFTEINLPASITISAAFSNNLQTYGVMDPQTASWAFRVGVSEGNGGTLIAYGDGPAQLSDTGRNAFGLEEYETVTRTSVRLPAGNVWFEVTPDCTNPNDAHCNEMPLPCADWRSNCGFMVQPRYFETDTDGLNGINTKFTVTSNDGFGPLFAPEVFFGGFYSWCNDSGVACGDGMSAGLLK